MSRLSRQLSRRLPWRRHAGLHFTGDYSSWEAALKDATGYDAPAILAKTRDAVLKVKRGEAAYERDSVLFDKVEHSFPLLAGLLRAAARQQGELRVLDFGGALGSTYFQSREFLAPVSKLVWCIVEQPAQVACGKSDLESKELRFFSSVDECLAACPPNLLLLSSVLQYLPSPYETLGELVQRRIPHLIIDRTSFLEGEGERLTVQHVPASIYPASYPAWFLSESRLQGIIQEAGYRMLADFPAADVGSPIGAKACCKGFIYESAAQG
jgi:putative methyltransferase (TIGR04325 family)